MKAITSMDSSRCPPPGQKPQGAVPEEKAASQPTKPPAEKAELLTIDIVFNDKELKVTIAKDERLKDLQQRAKQICETHGYFKGNK